MTKKGVENENNRKKKTPAYSYVGMMQRRKFKSIILRFYFLCMKSRYSLTPMVKKKNQRQYILKRPFRKNTYNIKNT